MGIVKQKLQHGNLPPGVMGMYIKAIEQAALDAEQYDPTAALWLLGSRVEQICSACHFEHETIARAVGAMLGKRR